MKQCSRTIPRIVSTRPSTRSISTTNFLAATPLPHPVAPGPLPKPPVPLAASPDERLERRRKQAELLKRGQNLRANPTKPGSILQKRFWKNVSVNHTPDGLQIMLDARPVKTPSRNTLTIPHNKPHLATAIALEWDLLVSAHQALKHHYIPLTSLTSRALDIQSADTASNRVLRQTVVRMVMGYLTTDTLLCWAPSKNRHDAQSTVDAQNDGSRSLRTLQMNTASPIIQHLTTRVWPGVELNPILEEDSILPNPQPEGTTHAIQDWVSRLPAFELAALERAVLASKSLLVAARLLTDWSHALSETQGAKAGTEKFTIEDAAEACSLEVSWQTGMWGEVEDTHDVDKEDVRRQLGSVILLVQAQLH